MTLTMDAQSCMYVGSVEGVFAFIVSRKDCGLNVARLMDLNCLMRY